MNEPRTRDYRAERERFELLREKVILATGVVGILGDLAAAAIVKPDDPSIFIALGLTFGGVLGLPTTLRADSARRGRRDEE